MLASGQKVAPWICLRCQMRLAARPSRTTDNVSRLARGDRTLSSSPRSYEEYGAHKDEAGDKRMKFYDKSRDEYMFKSYYRLRPNEPHGRVIRKGDRRQWQTSQKLSIDSLSKPSQVILFRDIGQPKPPQSKRNKYSKLKKQKVRLELDDEAAEATATEVDANINALRPTHSSIPDKEFLEIVKRLSKSFNKQQLAAYLEKALGALNPQDGSETIQDQKPPHEGPKVKRSAWIAGRWPMEKRLPLPRAPNKALVVATKPKLAKRIVNIAWGVSMASAKDRIGELELHVEPWQREFLFQRTAAKVQIIQEMVGSSLLLRQAEVLAYGPANVVRIVGTEEIASDIASRLQSALSTVESTHIDMSVFYPLLDSRGNEGNLRTLLAEEDLRGVSMYTASAYHWTDDKTLSIYGRTRAETESAQRLLLSYLELPDPTQRNVGGVKWPAQGVEGQYKTVPETNLSSMHARHRNKHLMRTIVPISRKASSVQNSNRGVAESIRKEISSDKKQELSDHVQHVVAQLEDMQPLVMTQRVPEGLSHWTRSSQDAPGLWNIQLCRLLLPSSILRSKTLDGFQAQNSQQDQGHAEQAYTSMITQPELPGVATLLSYFTPKDTQAAQALNGSMISEPQLRAKFVPSPFTPKGLNVLLRAPSVELGYKFKMTEAESDRRDIQLSEMKALVEEQSLSVPLPNQTCDLRISRQHQLFHLINGNAVNDGRDLHTFTETLRASVQAHGHQALAGQSKVTLIVPMQQNGCNDYSLEHVEYLFERFEHVQSIDFVPPSDAGEHKRSVDSEVRSMLAAFPPGAFLRYKEVEGGPIGGRWTELHLMVDPLAIQNANVDVQSESGLEATGNESGEAPEETLMGAATATKRAQTEALLKTSMALARLLSRIEAGALIQSRGHARPATSSKSEDEGENFPVDALSKANISSETVL